MKREGQSIQKSIQHQAIDSFYILSYDLINYYKNRTPYNNIIVRSNQRCILRRVFFYFYVSALIFADFSNSRLQEEMKNIEELIDDNVEIKHDAYSFSYKGIPFVKIWYTSKHILYHKALSYSRCYYILQLSFKYTILESFFFLTSSNKENDIRI